MAVLLCAVCVPHLLAMAFGFLRHRMFGQAYRLGGGDFHATPGVVYMVSVVDCSFCLSYYLYLLP